VSLAAESRFVPKDNPSVAWRHSRAQSGPPQVRPISSKARARCYQAEDRGLTLRSRRGPTAGHQARRLARLIIQPPGPASHRRPRLTSNVRHRIHAPLPFMHTQTAEYNAAQSPEDQETCGLLAKEMTNALPEAENKVWHAHPVWFLDGNPVVGYSKLKGCIRLLFWSGQSFATQGLSPEGKFKAAEARFATANQVDLRLLRTWLSECRTVQWDYKNIVKRRGVLERLK
jgi:hypothetical protein